MPRFNVTPYECAVIARLAYQRHRNRDLRLDKDRGIPESATLPVSWILKTEHYRSSESYSATIAVSAHKKAVIIAIRGTDNVHNLKTDLIDLMGLNTGIVFKLVQEGVDIFNEKIQNKYPGYHFIFTGHSLGGFLANLTLLALIKANGNTLEARAETVVFDAPGITNFYNPDQGIGLNRYAGDSNLLLTNYVSGINYVNTCQPHIGKIQQLKMPDLDKNEVPVPFQQAESKLKEEAQRGSGLSWNAVQASSAVGSMATLNALGSPLLLASAGYIGYSLVKKGIRTLQLHSIDNIVLAINPRSGVPFHERSISRFPSLKSAVMEALTKGAADFIPFLEPEQRDLLVQEVGHFIGANPDSDVELSLSRNKRRSFEKMELAVYFVSCFFGIYKLFIEKQLLPITMDILLFSLFFLRNRMSTLLNSFSSNINHVGSIVLCNQTYIEEHQLSQTLINTLRSYQTQARSQFEHVNKLPKSMLTFYLTNFLHFIPLFIMKAGEWVDSNVAYGVTGVYLFIHFIAMAPLMQAIWINEQMAGKIISIYKNVSFLTNKLKRFDFKNEAEEDVSNSHFFLNPNCSKG